jgi:hypothetical protein
VKAHDAAQYPIDFTEVIFIFLDQSNEDGKFSVKNLSLC